MDYHAFQVENEILRYKLQRLRRLETIEKTKQFRQDESVSDYMHKEGIQEQLDKFDNDLIGLLVVKKRVKEIALSLVINKIRHKLGFDINVPSLHMCFTGEPGTGKKTVAMYIGKLLSKMGYIRSGHVVFATRDDFVGQYKEDSVLKTEQVIKQALGGVLFIDKAYFLYNSTNYKEYGQDSIEFLLTFMEQNKDLVVILAGNKDKMDSFFSFMPGVSPRIENRIDFSNYTIDELFEIAKKMAGDIEYEVTHDGGMVFKRYIQKKMNMPYFSNAHTVRNTIDRARMHAALRIFNESEDDAKQLNSYDFQVLLDEVMEL